MSRISKVIEKIYIQIVDRVGLTSLDTANIIGVAASVMTLVEQYKDLSGVTKKEIVISVIKRLVEIAPLSKDKKDALEFVVNNVLPTVIDKLVDSSSGKLKLNIKGKCCF